MEPEPQEQQPQDQPQAFGDLPEDQRRDIAAHFVLSSPPGEEKDVLRAVRTLINDDSVLEPVLTDIMANYNTEQLIPVKLPDSDEKVLITQHGMVDQTHFVDPGHSQLITFDHVNKTIIETRPLAPEELTANEPLRALLDAAVGQYVKRHFPEGAYAVYSNAFEDGSFALVICIHSSRYNENSYWSSRWRSVWTFTMANFELTGTMSVNVHLYENGNVQLKTSHEASSTLGEAEHPALVEAIMTQIEKHETEYQAAIDHSFDELQNNTFKGLRRVLPISKKKLDWGNILASAGVGRELGGR